MLSGPQPALDAAPLRVGEQRGHVWHACRALFSVWASACCNKDHAHLDPQHRFPQLLVRLLPRPPAGCLSVCVCLPVTLPSFTMPPSQYIVSTTSPMVLSTPPPPPPETPRLIGRYFSAL